MLLQTPCLVTISLNFYRGTGATNTSPRSGSTATGSGATGSGATGLDVKQLDRTVCSLYQAGLAPSTQKAYSTGTKRYTSFCERLTSACDGDHAVPVCGLFEVGGPLSPDSQIISVGGVSPADFPRNGGPSD